MIQDETQAKPEFLCFGFWTRCGVSGEIFVFVSCVDHSSVISHASTYLLTPNSFLRGDGHAVSRGVDGDIAVLIGAVNGHVMTLECL